MLFFPQHALKDVLQFREANLDKFTPSTQSITEYLPWTAAVGPEGLVDSLNIQVGEKF